MATAYRSSRRGAQMQNKQYDATNKKRGGGKLWSLRFKPTTVPTRLHFTRPEQPYKDRFDGTEAEWLRRESHFLPFMNGGKGGVMECNREDCLVCVYGDPQRYGFADIDADSSLRKCYSRASFVLSGFEEEWFHLVKQSNRETGKSYFVRERCGGKRCEKCQSGDARVFGRKMFVEFSKNAWDTVIDPLVERVEKKCRCGGDIYIPQYVCEHCGESVIDLTNFCPVCESRGRSSTSIEIDVDTQMATCKDCGTDWSLLESEDPDLKEAVLQQYTCASCGKPTIPVCQLECTNCQDPDPYGLFDIQVTIKKESDQKMAGIEVVSWKVAPPDERLFDPKFQGDESDKSEEGQKIARAVAERNQKPVDLTPLFTIESPAVQAKMLNKPNPFSTSNEERALPSYAERYEDPDQTT